MVLKLVRSDFCRISINFIVKGMCYVSNLFPSERDKQIKICSANLRHLLNYSISLLFLRCNYHHQTSKTLFKAFNVFSTQVIYFDLTTFLRISYIKGTLKLHFCSGQINRFIRLLFLLSTLHR